MNSKYSIKLSYDKDETENFKHRIFAEISGGETDKLLYKKGNYDINKFKEEDATPFDDKKGFGVDKPGFYTVYGKDKNGNEVIEVIEIPKKKILGLSSGLFTTIVVILSLAVVSAAIAITYNIMTMNHRTNTPAITSSNTSSSKPIPVAHIHRSLRSKASSITQNRVTDKLSSAATFDSNTKGSAGTWEMKDEDSNTVDMQAELLINNKVVGASELIKPGQSVDAILLTSDIPKGTYKAYVAISYYNTKTKAYISKALYQIGVTAS